MNIRLQNPNPMAAGRSALSANGLMKSTVQKLERQARRDSQVAFFENQKANLKNIECSSPEEAARVLELLYTYEDQIASVKAEYNNAQMFHLMDEAKERGEEIAKAIEKSEPKTEQERKKEAVEEALGIDEEQGMLSDILDEIADKVTESLEDMSEAKKPPAQDPAQAAEPSLSEPDYSLPQETLPEHPAAYRRFDAFA